MNHGTTAYSDHIPIWLDIEGKKVFIQGSRHFRFEIMWLQEKKCTKIVEDAWRNGGKQSFIQDILRRITSCSEQLKRCNRM